MTRPLPAELLLKPSGDSLIGSLEPGVEAGVRRFALPDEAALWGHPAEVAGGQGDLEAVAQRERAVECTGEREDVAVRGLSG